MSQQRKQKSKDKPKIGSRLLTISKSGVESQARGNYRKHLPPVPFIRLRGKWLEDAGFEAGERVQVITSNNLLVIIPEKEDSD